MQLCLCHTTKTNSHQHDIMSAGTTVTVHVKGRKAQQQTLRVGVGAAGTYRCSFARFEHASRKSLQVQAYVSVRKRVEMVLHSPKSTNRCRITNTDLNHRYAEAIWQLRVAFRAVHGLPTEGRVRCGGGAQTHSQVDLLKKVESSIVVLKQLRHTLERRPSVAASTGRGCDVVPVHEQPHHKGWCAAVAWFDLCAPEQSNKATTIVQFE
jgi:hypothetical protein